MRRDVWVKHLETGLARPPSRIRPESAFGRPNSFRAVIQSTATARVRAIPDHHTMKKMMMNYKYLGIPLVVLALASCGGGGGDDSTASGSGSTSSPTAAAAQANGAKTFPSTCYSNKSPGNSNNTFGSFTVSSNIWNPGAATAYNQCTSATIQSPGGVTAAEFDWNFTSTSGSVLTYPNLQFGQQNSYNASTTSILPAPISALPV